MQVAIVLDHLLADTHRRQRDIWLKRRHSGTRKQRQIVFVAGATQRTHRPQRLPAIEAERTKGISRRQPFQHRRLEGAPQPEVADRIEACAATTLDRMAVILGKPANLAKAKPHHMGGADVACHFRMAEVDAGGSHFRRVMPRESGASSNLNICGFIAMLRRTESSAFADDDTGEVICPFPLQVMRLRISHFQRTIPTGVVDVDRSHLDAMLLSISHDLGRCIKTHGLAVEQRRREYVRIAALHPGRDIDEKCKARSMAFRKAVFAEAFDLAEAAFGKMAWITA